MTPRNPLPVRTEYAPSPSDDLLRNRNTTPPAGRAVEVRFTDSDTFEINLHGTVAKLALARVEVATQHIEVLKREIADAHVARQDAAQQISRIAAKYGLAGSFQVVADRAHPLGLGAVLDPTTNEPIQSIDPPASDPVQPVAEA